MQAELWKKIEALYGAALVQPPEQRAAFLAQACPDDSQLRGEVESLLASSFQAVSFLEGSSLPSCRKAVDPRHIFRPIRGKPAGRPRRREPGPARSRARSNHGVRQCPGTIIGPYRLVKRIGQGGMG